MKKIIEKIKYYINNSDELIEKGRHNIEKAKKMVNSYIKTNVLFFSFVVLSLMNSTALRFFTAKNYFNIKPLLADLAVIILIGAFGYFFKVKKQFRYYFTWTIILTAMCIINSLYYTNYLSFASVSLLATSMQVVDVADAVYANILELKDFIYFIVPITFIIINITLKRKGYFNRVEKIEAGKVRAMNTLVVGLITLGFFLSTLNGTDISRLNKQWNREYVVMQFGIYAYQFNDLVISLKPQISPLFGYDEASKEFRTFYEENATQPVTNDYTDIFKGKNLIAIHAESIQQFLIDEKFNNQEVTPNLNRLANEGIYFSNFYAQESVGTSSDTEFTLNTSLMPASSGTVFVSYWNREYVTIPKLLKEKDYYSFSMHGNNATFWNRNNMHPKLGYDHFYAYESAYTIDEKIGLGLSDKSFFRQSVPIISKISEENKNFYGTLIMLTNHTPWTDIDAISDFSVEMPYQAIDEFTGVTETKLAPYLEGTKLGSYVKSVNYADAAIGQFIADMDAAGLLENTVIMIYGDHDAKLKPSDFIKYYNYDPATDSVIEKNNPDYQDVDFYDYELNRKVPLIFWSKNNKVATEVTEVMGMYDVMPTLGNMFGFYNPYAIGHDIFSINENVVVFPDGNWLTNKMYYNSQKEEGLLLKADEPVSIEYINKYTQFAESAVSVSDKIIVYDLIKKLIEVEETNNTK